MIDCSAKEQFWIAGKQPSCETHILLSSAIYTGIKCVLIDYHSSIFWVY